MVGTTWGVQDNRVGNFRSLSSYLQYNYLPPLILLPTLLLPYINPTPCSTYYTSETKLSLFSPTSSTILTLICFYYVLQTQEENKKASRAQDRCRGTRLRGNTLHSAVSTVRSILITSTSTVTRPVLGIGCFLNRFGIISGITFTLYYIFPARTINPSIHLSIYVGFNEFCDGYNASGRASSHGGIWSEEYR